MFERTGNLWRAQGRRVRLELKHFQRHVMAHALLNPDDIEGWRGVIEEGEVVKDHETVLDEEARERGDEREDTTRANEADEVNADEEAPADETVSAGDEAPEQEAADEETADEESADEEAEEGAPTEANGDRGRRPAVARGGSRGRTGARAR
jgi:hypothetical protein